MRRCATYAARSRPRVGEGSEQQAEQRAEKMLLITDRREDDQRRQGDVQEQHGSRPGPERLGVNLLDSQLTIFPPGCPSRPAAVATVTFALPPLQAADPALGSRARRRRAPGPFPRSTCLDHASPIAPLMSKIAPMAPSDPASRARPCVPSHALTALSARVVARGKIR